VEEEKKQSLWSKDRNMYVQPLKIGNITLKNNIVLAPMAGITDLPFRRICEKFEPGLVYTEMISSKGLFYKDEKTKQLLKREGEKGPVAVQIFGSSPETMAYAARYVSEYADIIDINMGCPAPKVVKNGDGSKLLLNIPLIGEIVEAVVANSNKPVSVKMRLGWDAQHIVAEEVAKMIEKAGASAITVHGRTREQFYSGQADLEWIKKVKQAVSIPVIGNGDIISGKTAEKMFAYTGVDGIMIGRASFGKPWIFKEILNYLQSDGKETFEMSFSQMQEVILQHIDLAVGEKKEEIAIKELRKHMNWYIKNQKEATKMRMLINTIETRQDLEKAIIEYFAYLSI